MRLGWYFRTLWRYLRLYVLDEFRQALANVLLQAIARVNRPYEEEDELVKAVWLCA